jgi:hypothetical protein
MQELLQRDIRIVRWFIEDAGWTNRGVKADSSLGRLLEMSEKLDLRAPAPKVEELGPERGRHGLHLTASLVRLAWAIRALHGNGGVIDRVDASFIDRELLGEDTKERDAERTLPGGVGTLVFAARLVQAGKGRVLSINGNAGVGHDIKWVTGAGDTVYVERKDRSYEAGLADTLDRRIGRVIYETLKAGLTMPRDKGAARVLVVGFQDLVRAQDARHVDQAYTEAFKRELLGGRVPLRDLPHLVIVEHLGLEPKSGGAKFDYFSPQPINIKRHTAMARSTPLLARALGMFTPRPRISAGSGQ